MNISINENCTLYHNDCLSLLKELPDKSVDMMLVDPPYGITDAKWDKPLSWPILWLELERVCKENAAIAMFASSKFVFELVNTNLRNYRYKYIWVKNISTGFLNAKKAPLRRYEEICIFFQNQPTYNPQRFESDKRAFMTKTDRSLKKREGLYNFQKEIGKVRTYDNTRLYDDVLNFNAMPTDKRLHSSQKPTELLEHLIKTYTNEGDLVLDFCMGSGSTGEAALNTNRRFIGCEIDKQVFDLAEQRLRQVCSNHNNKE